MWAQQCRSLAGGLHMQLGQFGSTLAVFSVQCCLVGSDGSFRLLSTTHCRFGCMVLVVMQRPLFGVSSCWAVVNTTGTQLDLLWPSPSSLNPGSYCAIGCLCRPAGLLINTAVTLLGVHWPSLPR